MFGFVLLNSWEAKNRRYKRALKQAERTQARNFPSGNPITHTGHVLRLVVVKDALSRQWVHRIVCKTCSGDKTVAVYFQPFAPED